MTSINKLFSAATISSLILLSSGYAFTKKSGAELKKDMTGAFVLRGQNCKTDKPWLERFKDQVARRTDSMPIQSEIMIISPNGEIRKFNKIGELVSEGHYIITNNNEMLVRTTGGEPIASSSKIKSASSNGLVLLNSANAKCKGTVLSSYLKVRTFPDFRAESYDTL